jgi:threonylcarbamoyladenosine tRNA methylthiotransferase MtaB
MVLRMATFSIENFGCRATEADAAALRHGLLAKGFHLTDDQSSADLVVLNTCTVTAAADSQALEAVRKIHRANPAARIIVTGCYAQRDPEEIAGLEGVSWVIGNSHQMEIPKIAADLIGQPDEGISATAPLTQKDFVPTVSLDDGQMSLARGPAKILTGDIFAQTSVQVAPVGIGEGDRTRPVLKIQDGCNNRCSYCVIPFVRGRSRSLSAAAVVAEVQKLVAGGSREIVLSGINLGAYGRDLTPRASLFDVIHRILGETDLEQLRLSSIEPQDVTEELISLIAGSPRLAPHFHVPLQSGSDRILRAMHRWYRAGHYGERVKRIRQISPDAAIGADIIVGFPAEMDEDFQATFEFIEHLPFSYLHVFSFSARPGTEGANLDAPIPGAIIRERARALRALAGKKSSEFRAMQAGRVLRALTLAGGEDSWTPALTANYLKVRIPGRVPANEWRQASVLLDETSTENYAAASSRR